MNTVDPRAELDNRYSEPGATATSWDDARKVLESAGIFWLTTVRADGRPHVTPLIAVWVDDAIYFATGEEEQKARNLIQNPHCVLTTGCNTMGEGLDVVVEGAAVRVINERQLTVVADAIDGEVRTRTGDSMSEGDALEGRQGNVAWVLPRPRRWWCSGSARAIHSARRRWRFGDP